MRRPLQLEFERGGRDRDAALLLELHPVGRGVAAGLAPADGAGELNRAGIEQQLLRQRRLARVRVRNDRERCAVSTPLARARRTRTRPRGSEVLRLQALKRGSPLHPRSSPAPKITQLGFGGCGRGGGVGPSPRPWKGGRGGHLLIGNCCHLLPGGGCGAFPPAGPPLKGEHVYILRGTP